MNREGKLFNVISYIYLTIAVLLVVTPLYLLLVVSFKPLEDSVRNFFAPPTSLYLENFKVVLSGDLYLNSVMNSVFVTVIPLAAIILIVPMCAFTIARNMHKTFYKWMYRYFISSIFVPFAVIMIPTVILCSKLNIMNVPGLIIVYIAFSINQALFLFVGHIRNIPRELDESAHIDGCSVPRLYFSIILPLCKPMIATVAVINSLWYWNDFLLPVVLLNKSQRYFTLALYQYMFNDPQNYQFNLAFASYFLGMIPLVVLYLSAQKYVVKGLTAGAIKG
jgi:raffinose/stachyose/melibiose transport system permease protein